VRRLEKVEELKFCKYVRARGWKCIKLSTAGPFGERGHSDRLVLAPYKVALFFEFKRKGEVPTQMQIRRHTELITMGFQVHVVYTAQEAIKILLDQVHPKALSKGVHKVRS